MRRDEAFPSPRLSLCLMYKPLASFYPTVLEKTPTGHSDASGAAGGAGAGSGEGGAAEAEASSPSLSLSCRLCRRRSAPAATSSKSFPRFAILQRSSPAVAARAAPPRAAVASAT